MMISLSLFSILATISMGAVFTAINQHNRSQNLSQAMDNLNFIMEDMSRNIRLGTNFHCFSSSESGTGVDGSGNVNVSPQDCTFGSGSEKLVFQGSNGSAITYFIDTSTGSGRFEKIVGSGIAQVVTPSYISIDATKSGFIVYGSPQSDGLQPVINITLAGTVTYKGVSTKFAIETTVASRPLDG